VHRTTLPSRHGHDLQPVCGDADRLWVSTGVNVYQYVKPTDTFESGYAGNEGINRGAVKSVGNQPSGIVVSTVPRKGGLYEWTTDQVDLFLPESKRLLSGAACYKARILNPFYEPRQPVNPAKWRIGASLSLNDWVNGRVDIAEWVRAGIHSVELAWRNDSFNLFEPANESQCSGWIDEIRKRGMDVWTLHLPYGPMFDISVTDSDRSREVIERHIRLMQMAHGWDIRTVVLHPSWEPIADDERPSRLAACKQALAVLAHEADLLGIVIAVECLPRTCLGNTSGEMLELISADSRLRICCDVNHLLQEAPEQFIRKLGQRVVTVHMSDCDGVDERHWMPGCGIIRWNETIRALAEHGYSGPFLFEIRQPVVSELVTCWNRLMADYMEAYE
jgi:sugar phosphate isomerase/epimerase